MAGEQTLLEELRTELRPLEERILAHPFLEGLESGAIQKEKLKIFAQEQFHIVRSDLRSLAFAVSRFGGTPHRDFFVALLNGDLAGFDALMKFAQALNLQEEELGAYQPLPQAHAYTAYLAWMALYASEAEIAAAFYANLHAWGANCARMGRALKTQYGFKDPEVAFFDLFGAPSPDLEKTALAVMDYGLARATRPLGVKRIARLLQGYEMMFWDAMYQASA